MKNTINFSLSIIACSILVACSSGGGSSNDSSVSSNTPSMSSSSTNSSGTTNSGPTSTGSTNMSPAQSNNAIGAAYVIDGDGVSHKNLTDASNLNILVVDGQRLRVSYQDQGIFAGTWLKTRDSGNCCGIYNDTRFGVVLDANDGDRDYFYYQGNPTNTMPVEGSASYLGHFVMDADQVDDFHLLYGTNELDVNFGEKTVKGTFEGDNNRLKPLSMTAKISGNSFAGDLSSTDFPTKAKVEGKFFGDNAKELGGIFKDDKSNWAGAFGASK